MAHPKGLLIERLQKQGSPRPEFRTVNTGPEHQPTFLCDVIVDGEVLGTGQGSTKREAERLAAEESLAHLDGETVQLEAQEQPAQVGVQEEEEQEFEGPWPIFDDLLAATLTVANERVETRLMDEEARVAIRDFALDLYKDLLLDLGDVVDEDEEDDEEE